MMEKRHAKRSLILLLLAALLIASLSFVACSAKTAYAIKLDRTAISLELGDSVELGYQVTKDGEPDTEAGIEVVVTGDSVTYNEITNQITAKKIGKSTLTVSVKGNSKVSAKLTVSVPEYEIEIKGDSVQKADLDSEGIIEYTVFKDGTKVTDKKAVITVEEGENDVIKYEPVGNRVYFVGEGLAKVKVALESDPSVYAVKSYNVEKSFWNSGEHQVSKDNMTITDNSVYMPGGTNSQYMLAVLDGGSQYVFKTNLTIPAASVIGSQTVGVTHDLNRNNNGFWIGVHSNDNSTYEIYIKNFFGGWAGNNTTQYTNVTFDDETIEVITVRDGNKVWYSVDGYCGTFTFPAVGDKNYISADTKTWAGIFSQERKLTATNFSYSTEATEIAEAKALCEKTVIKFDVTNKGVNQVVKGTSCKYNTQILLAPGAVAPAVEWDLDKTNMTTGQAGTTITDGNLTLAADAEGVVTVIAKCDGKEIRFDVSILSESLADENETLKVDGGIELGADGSVTFTEAFNYNNSTLSDSAYQELYYAAIMKDKVEGDFEFAFTLTDMKSASTPKFLVSFGESSGNFIFTNNSVSIKTGSAYTASFTAADTLEVVIKVVAGHYAVSVNGANLTFNGDPIRRIEDYTAERPVLFTTGAGTSVKVSSISITDKTDAELIVANDKTTLITEEGTGKVLGIEIGFIADGWVSRNNGTTRTYYGKLLPTGNYTLSMKATFSAAMPDTKLGVQIGDQEFHISNGNGTIITELCNNNSWHDKRQDLAINALSVNLEFKQIGSKLYFFVNGVQHNEVNVPASRILTFWTFDNNANASPAGSKVSVTEISLTDGAIIASINGKNVVQAGETATYTATVLGASEEDLTWEFADGGLSAGTATFTVASKTLTLDEDATGTVVITLKYNGAVVAELTVTASKQPANQNTAIAESVGGVKQDVESGTISFDNASKNGVAHEDYYSEESGYYAILNKSQGVRATIQDNFVLQFTVSNYSTTAASPKLMISLGYKHEQFYIAYTSQGPRIEACLVDVATSNSKAYRWVNSEYFTGFDTNASHVYKLVCEDGIYSMTVDNTAITFPSTLYRRVDTMAYARNIMFSTNADTTADVSNITLTAVSGKEGKVTATYADNFTTNGDGSITATFNKQSRDGRNGYHDANAIYAYNGYVAENSEITLTVTWDDTDLSKYNDETLLIRLGTSDRSIGVVMNKGTEIKLDQQWTFEGYHLTQNDRLKTETNGKKSAKIKITIVNGSFTAVRAMEFNADGTEKGWSTDTLTIGIKGATPDDQKAEGYLTFGTFVYNTPSNCSVTISNISIVNS